MNKTRFLDYLKEHCDIAFLGHRRYQSMVDNNEFHIQRVTDEVNRVGTLYINESVVNYSVVYDLMFKISETVDDGRSMEETVLRWTLDSNGNIIQ